MGEVSNKLILVADDEPDIADVLKMFLESFGNKVFTASNGVEALELCEKHAFDFVISDMRMPGGSGIEFLRKLNSVSDTIPPFIFMTGFSDFETPLLIKEGAFGVLQKPFNLDDLLNMLKSANVGG